MHTDADTDHGSTAAAAWAADLGLPAHPMLTPHGQDILAAALAYRAASITHQAGPPHPNLLLSRPLIDATRSLLEACPDLEDVVWTELEALQLRRPTVGNLAVAVDTAITTALAGQHTGWRTIISVVPARSHHDQRAGEQDGTEWSHELPGIHPSALAQGCPPAGPQTGRATSL